MPQQRRKITKDEQAFLAAYDQTQYERPSVATDIVTFSMAFSETGSYRQDAQGRLEVLLVRRTEMPFQGQWALPGGFLRPGETLESCAARTLRAKTGEEPSMLIPAGVYSEPERDPRGWIVSRAFMSILPDTLRTAPIEGAAWFAVALEGAGGDMRLTLTHEDVTLEVRVRACENGYGQRAWEVQEAEQIAFDHAQILMTALEDLRWGAGVFRYIFDFLPETFTLSALQNVQETITGQRTGAANFRRKAAPYVAETGEATMGAGHRPAMLFRRSGEGEQAE